MEAIENNMCDFLQNCHFSKEWKNPQCNTEVARILITPFMTISRTVYTGHVSLSQEGRLH